MVVIPKLYPAVTIVHKSGARYEFYSYQSLFSSNFGKSIFKRQYFGYRTELADSYKFTKVVGLSYAMAGYPNWNTREVPCEYLAVDEYGRVIPEAELYAERSSYIKKAIKYRDPLSTWNGEGSVPGIHKRSRYGRAYYRKFSFKPILADAMFFKEEGEPPVRPSRNVSNTPSNWDDISRRKEHGWKQFRKHQYREDSVSCRMLSQSNSWNLD